MVEESDNSGIERLVETLGNTGPEHVSWGIESVDNMLSRLSHEERIRATADLVSLWQHNVGNSNPSEAFSRIFGERYGSASPELGRLMGTLTADERQFRVWYGVPGCIESTHVDSCGRNLLFEVYGDRELVRPYISTIPWRVPILVPNGATLFMNWENR